MKKKLNEILIEFDKAEAKLSTHPLKGGCSIKYAELLRKVYSNELLKKIRLYLPSRIK